MGLNTDNITSQIMTYIDEQGLRIGDTLPREQDLAQAMDCSRNSIREALSRLRMLGMVESRRRSGMTLASPKPFAGFEVAIESQLLAGEQMRSLLETRLVLEVGMADLLCYRISNEDLDELQSLVLKEKASPSDHHVQREVDRAFHAKLAHITQNQILMDLYQPLSMFFDSKVYGQELEERGEEGPAVSHADLVECLRRRDVEAYRKLMNAHLKCHLRHLTGDKS